MALRKMLCSVTFIFLLHISAVVSNPYFRGAVVEYGADIGAGSNEEIVKLNINGYNNIIKNLTSSYPDISIIVFPESGLTSKNPELRGAMYSESVPDPAANNLPCSQNDTLILHEFSCQAQSKEIYLVINMIENYSNSNITTYYNTDVVFDRNGVIVARYRKYNIFGVSGKPLNSTSDPEHITFTTDFNVTFGLFTCFDINFKDPALYLVSNSNATHFLFPSAWFSSLPYLTAIQQQARWSYSTNKILLAAGYNDPLTGSSGSGIYFGNISRSRSYDYKYSLQQQNKGNFAIVSYIPNSLDYDDVSQTPSISNVHFFFDTETETTTTLRMMQDNLNVYTVQSIPQPSQYHYFNDKNHNLFSKYLRDHYPNTFDKFNSMPYNVLGLSPNGSALVVYGNSAENKTVCHGTFCCDFTVNVTSLYLLDLVYPTKYKTFGEDFSAFKYSYSVFNGVKSYSGVATGGVQVCSIISCLNDNKDSCGKRTDDSVIDTISYSNYNYKKVASVFTEIKIHGVFSTNNTFVSPNIFMSSQYSIGQDNKYKEFGQVADSSMYTYTQYFNDTGLQNYILKIEQPILNLGSINIYSRLFDLDGTPETKNKESNSTIHRFSLTLIVVMVLIKNIF